MVKIRKMLEAYALSRSGEQHLENWISLILLKQWKIYKYHQVIAWNNEKVIARDNIAMVRMML